MARIRPYDRPARDVETTCNTAATINSCSLFAVSVSNDRQVGDAATATHETVYSEVVHPPCRSTTLPLIDDYSSVANMYCITKPTRTKV